MKGFLLSFFIFVLYVIVTTIASHFIKPQRHSYFFLRFLAPMIFIFLLAYYFTPPTLWILDPSWEANYAWIDMILGLIILLLNAHSYIDWFFAFNGGFSTSLMLLLLDYEPQGATSQELINQYYSTSGTDKIHSWRLPRLEATGYLKIDPETKICSLTKKGSLIARSSSMSKKLLNLGLGG